MKSFIAITLLAIASIASADLIHDPNYCYASDVLRTQQPRWSDRTSNVFIRGNSVNPNVSSCTPAKFWIYMRHGDRLPSTNDINRMIPFSQTQRTNIINAFLAGRSQLCLADFNRINSWNWNPNITVAIEQFLTVGGWNGVKALAERMQTYFPTLLPRQYSPNLFSFRHTDRQRTQATVRAFSDGLFGEGAWQFVQMPTPPNPDHLLRPHDDCPAYTQASNTEVVRGQWQNSAEFQQTLNQINDKLGLEFNRLTARQTRTMWEICQFEQLWYPEQDGPFCGAISPFNNIRLEYFEDIDEYYTSGYGLNPLRLGQNLNCPLMQDLLQFLTSNNPNEETARIYSTHQTAFQLFLVTLGVFGEDPPLVPENFPQQANRQWNTSRMSPMNTNIVAVRYNCPDGDDDVLFLMNEKPLVIPGCAANGLCKVNFITQRYSRFLGANCNTLRCSTL